MNDQKLTQLKAYLEKLGLQGKEITVYLYIHSKGPQVVSSIAKGCNLTRTHAYDIVRKLDQLGLCHALGSEYGKKIKALSSKQILELLEQKEREIIGMKAELKIITPLLESLNTYSPEGKSNVSYFSGVDNVRKLLNLSLQVKEPLVRIAGSELDMIEKLGEEFLIHYQTRRKNKKIKLLSLRPGIKRGVHEVFTHNYDKEYLREVKLRPEGEIRLKSNILLWDSSVAIFSFGDEIFGTLIDNTDLAVMMKSWFDFVWAQSKKI